MKKIMIAFLICVLTFCAFETVASAASPTKITSVNLNGFDTPVPGASRENNLADLKASTGPGWDVRWAMWECPLDGTVYEDNWRFFGSEFWVTGMIRAAEGYDFDSACRVTIDGSSSLILKTWFGPNEYGTGNFLWFETVHITVPPLQKITKVTITFPEPVAGNPIDLSKLKVTTTPANAVSLENIQWKNITTHTYNDTEFKAGDEYYLEISGITPKPGYDFDLDSARRNYLGTVIINGKIFTGQVGLAWYYNERPSIKFNSGTYSLKTPIKNINITIPEPVVGGDTRINAPTITTTPENALNYVEYSWYNVTESTSYTPSFKNDCIFRYSVKYYIKSNFRYDASTCKATVNGKAASITVDGSALYISADFMISKNPSGPITSVAITGLKEPVVGESTAIKASDLTLVSSPANACTIVSVQWFNGTDGTSADTTFRAGCEYYLIVSLTPADGCNFKWGSSGLTYSGKATFNSVNARSKIRTSLTAKNLKIYSEYYTPAPCKHTDIELKNTVDVTCTKDGYTGDIYCTICGEVVESGHSIPKTGHTESDWIIDKAAAPGVEGAKHKECTVCHTVLKTETIPALKVECKHTNTEIKNTVKATCMEEGYTGDTVCKDCGKTITAGMNLPTLGHDYEEGVCTRCGAKDPDYKPAETEPAETEPAETEPVETEPTETEPTETEPTETEPVETEPTETKPTETEPTETEPNGTEPTATDPVGTEGPGTEPAGKTEKASSLWWLWIVAAFLVGGGGVFAVMKIKNKEN